MHSRFTRSRFVSSRFTERNGSPAQASAAAPIAYTVKATKFETQAADRNIVTAAFTPANGSLLVALCAATNPDGTGTPSITDSAGLTWTPRVEKDEFNSWSGHVSIYTAPVVTGTSMTVTYGTGATSLDAGAGASITVVEVTGYNTTTPAPKTFSASGGARSGSYTGNFSSAPSATSLVFAVAHCDGDTPAAADIAPGTGWTELYEQVTGTYGADNVQVRGSSTSTAVLFNTLVSDYVYVVGAVEIAAAA